MIVEKIFCKIIPTLGVTSDGRIPTPVYLIQVIVDDWPSDGAQTSMDSIGEQKIHLAAWSEERVKHVIGRETGRKDERPFAHLLVRRGMLNNLLSTDSLENPSVLNLEYWVLEELFDRSRIHFMSLFEQLAYREEQAALLNPDFVVISFTLPIDPPQAHAYSAFDDCSPPDDLPQLFPSMSGRVEYMCLGSQRSCKECLNISDFFPDLGEVSICRLAIGSDCSSSECFVRVKPLLEIILPIVIVYADQTRVIARDGISRQWEEIAGLITRNAIHLVIVSRVLLLNNSVKK